MDIDNYLSQSDTNILAEKLLAISDAEFSRAQQVLFEQCDKVQEAVLNEILSKSKDTEYGKAYNFEDIHDVNDYLKNVPLTVWTDYEPYSKRLEDGEADIIFPGRAEVFYITSGTTGSAKYLPDNKEGMACRKLISRSRREFLLACLNDSPGKMIIIANPPVKLKTRGGIPCGYASGQTLNIQSQETISLLAYPYAINDAYTGDDYNYMLLRCALPMENIMSVMGNSSMVFNLISDYAATNAERLIEDIKNGTCALEVPPEIQKKVEPYLAANPERAGFLAKLLEDGCFTPRFYWPRLALACFWLSGSVGRYIDETKRILPESTKYMDIGYGASEMKFNIPIKAGSPSGALATYGGFFEFIPEGGESTLLAHQLEDGKRYELVITTYAGLYRYRMNDIIQVDGFIGNTPCIYFVSKSGDIASVYKETIPGYLFYNYINETAENLGFDMIFGQVYCDADEKRYVVCIELAEPYKADAQALAKAIDDKLCSTNILYARYRNVVVRPLAVVIMKNGWKNHLLEKHIKKAGSAAQLKLPIVITGMPDNAWIQ